MEYAILTTSLNREFGDFKALNELNLKVKKGEIYGLLVPNGAGKTTSINVLCRLLTPSSGKVFLMGSDFLLNKTSSRIGYKPQETALYASLTVHQNMQFYAKLFDMDDALIEDRERELLDFVDLSERRNELVQNLIVE